MPHAADFRIATCQATIFTPDAALSAAAFMGRLMPTWATRFDGDPVMLPLPEGIPAEVPKIILQSRSQHWRCEIAAARLSIIWRRPAVEVVEVGFPEFFGVAVPLFEQYCDFLRAEVRRVAAVTARYAPHRNPGRYLAEHFCRDRWLAAPFNRPENFELHAHKEFALTGEIRVNSWVRSKTGKLNNVEPIVIVEQDLNSRIEDMERTFDVATLRAFFDAASVEFDTILQLYYPADAD